LCIFLDKLNCKAIQNSLSALGSFDLLNLQYPPYRDVQLMLSHDFLLQIAATYGLTPEQREVFLMRLLEGKSHVEIAKALKN
jgi:DNA-directed RNA polymerase specialized sigma24 family protein